MKIVIINGSPRENGLTATILRNIGKNMEELGANVEYFDLVRLTMSQCQGCCVCYMTGRCYLNDDAEMITKHIEDADGLILGSPTYASNVSGYMKLLIDRGHFVIEQLLSNKYCITVATGENYGNKKVAKILNELISYSGGRLVRSVAIKAPFNNVDSVKYNKLGSVSARKLFDAISARKKYHLQAVFHWIIFTFGIKPFVMKKGSKYEGVVTKWKGYSV